MRRFLAACLPAVACLACAAEKAPVPYRVEQVRFASDPGGGEPTQEGGDQTPAEARARKLVRSVDLSLEVDDATATFERVEALTVAADGYVASVDAYRGDDQLHYEIGLRIPVARLEEVVDQIKALAAEVHREFWRTEDVTGQYIDLEARLRTLGATEEELRALLAESRSRGHGAEDIMAIYRELTEIRTRIEQYQGQLDALSELTTLSRVEVLLIPSEAARPLTRGEWRPLEVARASVRTLLAVLRGLADFAIALMIVGLPVGLIVGLPLWLAVRWWRRRRR